MNKFCFFIGAHKTGTTYINRKLMANNDVLFSNGIRFEASETVGPNLSQFLHIIDDRSIAKATQFIRSSEDDYQRVIFSHENLSGIIKSLYWSGELYPHVRKRMETLYEIMDGESVDVIFNIRSYEQFILSSYSEYIRSYRYVTFSDFEHRVKNGDISWLRVLDSIQAGYPSANLMVHDYSLLRNNEEVIFQALLGEKQRITLRQSRSRRPRPSISSQGIKLVEAIQKAGIRKVSPRFVNILAFCLPKSRLLKGIEPWKDCPIEAKQWQNLFHFHMEKAQNQYKFLTLEDTNSL